jgi:cobalt/nickel transport system permease protein
MWVASAGTIAYCSKKVREELDDRKVPLMGVLGAFIFAAQMINFTIPATGSSGHLGGGLILAILLGPYAAFLTIASVLVVQALFFADGGLLALGCNIFNLGIFPAFIAYPFIYRKIVVHQPTSGKILAGSLFAAVVGLQLGAFCVVLETVASGISSLPFATFVTLMQPIHLGIGVVEGLVTAVVVTAVAKARPEILQYAGSAGSWSVRKVAGGFLVVALLTGGVVSWFASANPDGLEWSIAKVTGKEEVEAGQSAVHGALAMLQEKLAFLPDYNFRQLKGPAREETKPTGATESHASVPAGTEGKAADNRAGTSVAGLVGGMITLAVAAVIGLVLRKRGANS